MALNPEVASSVAILVPAEALGNGWQTPWTHARRIRSRRASPPWKSSALAKGLPEAVVTGLDAKLCHRGRSGADIAYLVGVDL